MWTRSRRCTNDSATAEFRAVLHIKDKDKGQCATRSLQGHTAIVNCASFVAVWARYGLFIYIFVCYCLFVAGAV